MEEVTLPASAEAIETHISRVYLTADRAYKLKKPVAFGFVDYTTRERREHFCRKEVRLNEELAPGVYLGVVSIDGEPAVEMRRLPSDRMLDALLRRGAVEPSDIDAIADALRAFHDHAPACNPGDVVAMMRSNLDGAPAFVRNRLEPVFSRFSPRRGFFRDGHGDLHAGNICLPPGRVVIYDRIEFAAQIRCCDIASDTAFLAMDLERHGRADLARRLLDRYGKDAPEKIVEPYKIHRAAVRGNVAVMRGDRADALWYFSLALGYTLPPSQVLMCGLPGTGKSTAARALATPLRAEILRSDVVRKRLAGMAPTEHWKGGFFSGPYHPDMTRRTYATLLSDARDALRAGRNVIVDATFATRAWRERFAALGGPLTVVYLDCDDETIRRRLQERVGLAGEVSDAGFAEYLEVKERFEPPDELGPCGRVDAGGGAAPQELALTVLRNLVSQE